jgi:hypothetical protein
LPSSWARRRAARSMLGGTPRSVYCLTFMQAA